MDPKAEHNPEMKGHLLSILNACVTMQAAGLCVPFVDYHGHVNTVTIRIVEDWISGSDNEAVIDESFSLCDYSYLPEDSALACRALEESRIKEFIQHLWSCIRQKELIEWRGT